MFSIQPDVEIVPGYTLERRLGAGGYGEVWSSRDRHGFRRALKVVTLDAGRTDRELRAISYLKNVRHPNLMPIDRIWLLDDDGRELSVAIDGVQATAAGCEPGYLVISMPVAERSLADELRQHRRAGHSGLPLDRLLIYLEEVAKAVDFLNSPRHVLEEGGEPVAIVHRDIKPGNILLLGGSAVLSDLGIARVTAGLLEASLVGTPWYMAPECWAGEVDLARADQYSLALTYYNLRTGRHPLPRHASPLVIQKLHSDGQLELEELPAREEAVLRQATHRDPGQRFESCLALSQQLREAVRSDALPPPVVNTSRSASISSAAPRVPPPLPRDHSVEPAVVSAPPLAGDASSSAAPAIVSQAVPPPSRGTRGRRPLPSVDGWLLLGGGTLAAALGLVGFLVFRHDASHPADPSGGSAAATSGRSAAPSVAEETPPSLGDRFTNSIGMKLRWISGGTFRMGSPNNSGGWDEWPAHEVTVRGLYLGETEVTRGQWNAVMGASLSPDSGTAGEPGVRAEDANLPVTMVAWHDAVEFCQRLSEREQASYRLPTEAEWEYACRAGTKTRYSFGDDHEQLKRYAWFQGNSMLAGRHASSVVGLKLPNAWGLFDMHGNVREWCQDWYGDYPTSRSTPTEASTAVRVRVCRGGGWLSSWGTCRSAYRDAEIPSRRATDLGFRVVLEVPPANSR